MARSPSIEIGFPARIVPPQLFLFSGFNFCKQNSVILAVGLNWGAIFGIPAFVSDRSNVACLRGANRIMSGWACSPGLYRGEYMYIQYELYGWHSDAILPMQCWTISQSYHKLHINYINTWV